MIGTNPLKMGFIRNNLILKALHLKLSRKMNFKIFFVFFCVFHGAVGDSIGQNRLGNNVFTLVTKSKPDFPPEATTFQIMQWALEQLQNHGKKNGELLYLRNKIKRGRERQKNLRFRSFRKRHLQKH